MASLDGQPQAAEKKVWSFISIEFRPSEPLVSSISQLVSDFCEVGLTDRDISYRFRMAAHELAENITKYSTAALVSLEVELFELAGVHTLSMKTRNEASPDRLEEVERRLKALKTFPDPIELYDRLIAETAKVEGISGLGLARIRAEGGLSFDYSINGNELTLIVQGRVPEPRVPSRDSVPSRD
jgi:hypothetical protein